MNQKIKATLSQGNYDTTILELNLNGNFEQFVFSPYADPHSFATAISNIDALNLLKFIVENIEEK